MMRGLTLILVGLASVATYGAVTDGSPSLPQDHRGERMRTRHAPTCHTSHWWTLS